ncbi:hypothetical protein, partial [Acinetobacter baumannii]|uniref:hypothetical protein n=1 Tax=Acinetobacter baumannii TaxID=470 RepID=UPI003391629C
MGITLITLAQDKCDLQHHAPLRPQGYGTTFTFTFFTPSFSVLGKPDGFAQGQARPNKAREVNSRPV